MKLSIATLLSSATVMFASASKGKSRNGSAKGSKKGGSSNQPSLFTPGPNDGIYFSTSLSNDGFFVDGRKNMIQLLHCETDDECMCSTTGCLGEDRDIVVSSTKTAMGETVVVNAKSFDRTIASCPKGSQTPMIISALCFVGGASMPKTFTPLVFGPIIKDFGILNDNGNTDCDFYRVELLCKDADQEKMMFRAKGSKKSSSRSSAAADGADDGFGRGNKLYTPSGKFMFSLDSGEIFVDGSDYKIEVLAAEDNDEGWCTTVACLGEEYTFAIQGQTTTNGEKVIFSGNEFSSFFMMCPYGDQTAVLVSSMCDDGTDAGFGIDISFGPYIDFTTPDQDVSCTPITLEIECRDSM